MIGRTKSWRWTTTLRRGGIAWLTSASVFTFLAESPVQAAQRVAATTANASSGAGSLVALSAGVLLLGVGAFTILTWSRRQRAPERCELEREALKVAEQAVRYWAGAVAHLQHSAHVDDAPTTEPEGVQDAGRTNEASPLDKAMTGYARAVEVRDERQLDLIRCMAAGGGKVPASSSHTPTLEPLTFDTGHSASPPATKE